MDQKRNLRYKHISIVINSTFAYHWKHSGSKLETLNRIRNKTPTEVQDMPELVNYTLQLIKLIVKNGKGETAVQ